MDWLLIAVIILTIEILLVALLWNTIAESIASYPYLYSKGERAFQVNNLEKASNLYLKVANHKELQKLPPEHPIKLAVFQQLAYIYAELAKVQENKGGIDNSKRFYQEALLYKVKELQLIGEWEQLQENHPEIKELRLKWAKACRENNTDLLEALHIFFVYGYWEDFVRGFDQFNKQLAYASVKPEEKQLIEDRVSLARAVVEYHQGVNKILEGNQAGTAEVDISLKEIAGLLNENMNFLQIDEPLFNEIKEKLGHSIAEEIQSEAIPAEDSGENRQQEDGKTKDKGEKIEPNEDGIGNNFEAILKSLQKQSRVVSQVTERPGEVIIEVQTEWYLLPLIFQEELVERVARTYYALSRRKEGSIWLIFKDNKGREVARHTQLGIRVYT